MDTEKLKQQLKDLIDLGKKDESVAMLFEAGEIHGARSVVREVLEPVLVEFGELWMRGKRSLAHGYLCGKIAEELFLLIKQSLSGQKDFTEKRGSIVIGNIEDDFHPLGRKLVVTFGEAEGWNLIDLGNDVPAQQFVDSALENEVGIIAVSAMMYSTAKNISKVRKEIDSRGLSNTIKLAVGGAVFQLNPDLVEEVGGDGTAPNAFLASDLFKKLNPQ